MKSFAVILLSFLIISLSCKEMVTYTFFSMNKVFIELNYCINKDNLELKCHGKCYLKKNLQASHDQDQQGPGSSKEERIIPVYLPVNAGFIQTVVVSDHRVLSATGINLYSYKFQPSIFQPPKLS